jgi:hypothetical protein
MTFRGCGIKRSWQNLWYHGNISLEPKEKPVQSSPGTDGLKAYELKMGSPENKGSMTSTQL